MLAGTVLAGTGQVTDFGVGIGLAVGQTVNLEPGNTEQLVGLVFLERNVVFGHAGHHTGAASGTFVQIDNHSITFGLTEIACLCHQNLVQLN